MSAVGVIYTWGYGRERPRHAAREAIDAAGYRYNPLIVDIRRSRRSRNPHWDAPQDPFFYSGMVWARALGNGAHSSKWVRLDGAGDDLEFLADRLRMPQAICLVCCETDWRRCHRRHVADELARMTGAEVFHL